MENPNPHPSASKPSPWGNYLKEFLMLFLAITLGFFVENLREDFGENETEKEYMLEIVENLKYDTTRCRLNLETNERIFSGLDSLRQELKLAMDGKPNANRLYYFAFKYPGSFGRARFNTTAISELKNSGSMRLIRNHDLVNQLGDYYQRKIFAAEGYEPQASLTEGMEKERRNLFSLRNMDDYIKSFQHIEDKKYDPDYEFQKLLNRSSLRLRTSKPEDFEVYYSMVSSFEIRLGYYCFWLKLNQKTAVELMNAINREYKFETPKNGKE